MRGLISLAVIFFLALSAQASAKNFIRCEPKRETLFTSLGEKVVIEYGVNNLPYQFTFSFDVGKGSKIKNVSFGDRRVSSDKTDEFYIDLRFGPSKDRDWSKLKVDRISGNFWYEYKKSSSAIAKLKKKDFDPIKRVKSFGNCWKAKQKF